MLVMFCLYRFPLALHLFPVFAENYFVLSLFKLHPVRGNFNEFKTFLLVT